MTLTPLSTTLPQTPVFAPPATGSYDCETAALVRACLCPLFDRATSWKTLSDGLAARGYALAIRGGRLVIRERTGGQQICTARYLGTSLADLAARLGRPVVRARRDRCAAGDFRV